MTMNLEMVIAHSDYTIVSTVVLLFTVTELNGEQYWITERPSDNQAVRPSFLFTTCEDQPSGLAPVLWYFLLSAARDQLIFLIYLIIVYCIVYNNSVGTELVSIE